MSGFGRRLTAVSVVVALAIGAAACSSGGSGSGGSGSGGSGGSDQGAFVRPSLPGMGGPKAWPSAMPSDVPAFPFQIESFMPQRRQSGDTFGVRIFFVGVTKQGLDAYLAQLRAAGYKLEPKVYYTPPETEEDANRRAAAGDYDAWVATKSPRVISITVPQTPQGDVTFDLDGLNRAESDALPGMDDFLGPLPTPTAEISKTWPAEWAAKVPAPEGCVIGANGNMNVGSGNLYVACGYPDKDPAHQQAVADAYRAKLVAAGFVLQASPVAGMYRYVKGNIEVLVLTNGAGFMIINATER